MSVENQEKKYFQFTHSYLETVRVKHMCPKYIRIQFIADYGKCSKISNTFLFLFSNKMLIFRAGIHKMLVRIANREYPDQAASSEAV